MMSKPRVLLLSTMNPLPIDRGDKNRLFHIADIMQRSATVRLLCLRRQWTSEDGEMVQLGDEPVRRIPVERHQILSAAIRALAKGRPYSAFRFDVPSVRRSVIEEARKFQPDIVWGFQISTYPLMSRLRLDPSARRFRFVLDLVDCPSRYVYDTKAAPNIPLRERLANALNWQIPKWENRVLREADTVIVNLPQDIEYLRDLYGNVENVTVVPNCVPSHLLSYQWVPPSSASPRLLFVANLAYPPHRIALEQFALNIFPKIRRSLPSAELWVTGKGQDLISKRVLGLEGIHFTGFVPDLLDVYGSANMLVSPQSVITGLQYKTLEALAIGVPIIASRKVIETSGLTQGQDCLAADSAEEYVTAATRLWEDHKLAAAISAAGKMFIRRRHTWEAATEEIERILQMRYSPAE